MFITGATSGIGRATALAFAHESARVVVADVAADGNQDTARLIEQAGGEALAVTCASRAVTTSPRRCMPASNGSAPGLRLDNSSIEQPVKPTHEVSDDEWDRLVAVNPQSARRTSGWSPW